MPERPWISEDTCRWRRSGSAGEVLVRAFVGLFVEELAFCCKTVFRPYLLVVDQRALARAIKPVLERGEGDGLRDEHRKERVDCMHFSDNVHT